MEVSLKKLVNIFNPDFFECLFFIAVALLQAIPEQCPNFPIQNLQFCLFAVGVFKLI